MASLRIPGSKLGDALLRSTRRLLPTFEKHLVGGFARVAYSHIMARQRVDTNTLKSSTNVSAGEPTGRNLTYGPGNTPLPITVVDQALTARQFGERLVISEDAEKDGVAYGMFVEARYGTFKGAATAALSAAPRIIAEAATAATKEAFR